MEIVLTRSLNGVPMTHEEMKSYIFKSDVFVKVLRDVNNRVNALSIISTNDKAK
ncbi:MAG: hypothetical protein FWE27_05815 [Defluviitaleaceae bacterium]|nr:hypothetical protein [Defluviitaleaceae bacterium]